VRTYVTQERTVTERVLDTVTCDLCNKRIDPHAEATRPGQQQDLVVVEHEQVKRVDENRATVCSISFDICADCFAVRIIALVERVSGRKAVYHEETIP